MRLIARFAQEKEDFFEIITVYDERVIKERLNKHTPALISIAEEFPTAVWFERKISDDFGIEILYSKDKRPLVKHEHFPKDIFPMRKNYAKFSLNHQYAEQIDSPENYGVILGPTHPYHLESSQFQFFEQNKKILHFELMPFYKYRGIEKMLEGLTLEEARPIVERISAPQTIAYQTALLEIQLQASKKVLPEIIKKRHVFLLEFERILNHLNDLFILCQLVSFSEGASFFIKFLEEGRESMKKFTGHRFGFNAILLDAEFHDMEDVYGFLFALEKELLLFEEWIEQRDDILEKMLLLGQISKKDVEEYGLVGILARCVGTHVDRRLEDVFYEKNNFYINLEEGGDVFSRFNIRVNEIFTSLRVMKNLLKKNLFPFFLGTAVDGEYYSYVESSAGEIMMYIALKEGLIERFFIRDPSFLNAQILPICIKESDIDNLGLIVKSIPLHISAIDL